MIRTVAVFCGSRAGAQPFFLDAARDLGAGLAAAGIGLVYGGGRVGLMGALAAAALAGGGQVVGVIPRFLAARELAHTGLSELIVVDGLHARKQTMADLADAFVTLPGGFGTYDETVEILTWRLLGLHEKPILLCDVGGWAGALVAAFDAAVANGMADAASGRAWERLDGVDAVLARLTGG